MSSSLGKYKTEIPAELCCRKRKTRLVRFSERIETAMCNKWNPTHYCGQIG